MHRVFWLVSPAPRSGRSRLLNSLGLVAYWLGLVWLVLVFVVVLSQIGGRSGWSFYQVFVVSALFTAYYGLPAFVGGRILLLILAAR